MLKFCNNYLALNMCFVRLPIIDTKMLRQKTKNNEQAAELKVKSECRD